MDKYAIIVAAGSGSRMGGPLPKQFVLLRGKPVLWHTLHTFLQAFEDLQIILVLPEAYHSHGASLIADLPSGERIRLVTGGATRFHSVQNGLQCIPDVESIVFVHDGVRCLVTIDLLERCLETAMQKGNAVPAIAAVDSVRIEEGSGNAVADRTRVRLIQTPQTFKGKLLKAAFSQPFEAGFTDEASVVERLGEKIHLVEGEEGNIKITRPIDLLVAASIMQERAKAAE